MFCYEDSPSILSHRFWLALSRLLPKIRLLYLVLALMFLAGCDEPSSTGEDQLVVTPKVDPKAQFEWGMKRLERMLKRTRPSTADGLYTERKMTYELLAPNEKNDQYSAVVKITTESEFIHGKRNIGKKEEDQSEDGAKPKFKDPNDVDSRLVDEAFDIPGMGPQAPKTTAPPIKTRKIETEQVFELIYRDQQWQLKSEPEEELGKRWFEYAFPKQDTDS